AEAVEQVACDVVSALDRDFLDGIRHVLHGDGDKTFCHGLGTAPISNPIGELRKLLAYRIQIQRLVALRSEDRWKKIRLKLAKHEVCIGDGKRAAASVAGRSGAGAGGVRASSHSAAF